MNDFWKGRKVFITGGNGFVGSHITKALVDNGASVVALIKEDLSDSNFNRLGTREKVKLVEGSVENFELLTRIMREEGIDTCFHLAAQPIVGIANKSPLPTFETNIRGTWNLLEACRTADVKNIVVASSDKAYGSHEKLPYDENAPLKGLHPYDASKSCADILSQTYAKTYGLPVCITRCGNIYGGGDINFNRIVPGTFKSLIAGEPPIIRSNGTMVRDYIYIRDVVSAYLTLAEKMELAGIKGEAFNFGTSRPISVIELVRKIMKVTGINIEPKILNEAKNEIQAQFLSSKKAGEVLGWRQRYELEQGLAETYEWYREFFGK